VSWLFDGSFTDDEIDELLSGISFELYKVDGDGAPITGVPVAIGTVDRDGVITFDPAEVEYGWYAIVEVLTGWAADVFDTVDPLYVQVGPGGIIDRPVITDGVFEFQGVWGGTDKGWAWFQLDSPAVYPPWYNPFIDRGLKSSAVFKVTDKEDNVLPVFCADIYVDPMAPWYEPEDDVAFLENKERVLAALDWINDNYRVDGYGLFNPFEWTSEPTRTFETKLTAKCLASLAIWEILCEDVVLVEPDALIYSLWGGINFRTIKFLASPECVDIYRAKLASDHLGEYVADAIWLAGKGTTYDTQPILIPFLNNKTAFNNKLK